MDTELPVFPIETLPEFCPMETEPADDPEPPSIVTLPPVDVPVPPERVREPPAVVPAPAFTTIGPPVPVVMDWPRIQSVLAVVPVLANAVGWTYMSDTLPVPRYTLEDWILR